MREREYGIDALRIVSMWMIVILHVLGQGGILNRLEWFSFRYATAWFLECAAYGAVNCYGLISGYVGVKAKMRYSGILLLWLQVVFYSTLLTAVMHFLMPQEVASEEWLKGFFPVNFKYYWYYSAYFFISFLTPLMNKMLHTADKRELIASLLMACAVLSLHTTVFQQDVFLVNRGYSPLWLLMLYLIGGCIRLHKESLGVYRWIQKRSLMLFILGTTAAWAFKVCIGNNSLPFIFGRKITSGALLSYVSPAIIMSSISLFVCFAEWKPGKRLCKWISALSLATFGVYLIHVHPQIWKHCMKDAFASFVHVKAYELPFAVLAAATGILCICVLIDLLRIRVFGLLRIREFCQAVMARLNLT